MKIPFFETTFFFVRKYNIPLAFVVVVVLVLLLFFGYTSNDQKVAEKYTFYKTEQQSWKSKRVNQFIGDINYTATEVPLQYYISKNTGEDLQKIDSIYNTNNTERVIEIEFQHVHQKDLLEQQFTSKEYDEAVKYIAFKIAKDFNVIASSSSDTIKCAGVQFERNFKIAPFKRVLLYFNDIDTDDTIQLIYEDQLFGNGLIKFNFNNTPILL